ncbi:MAG: hypothetical protein IJH05_10020, partial [Firmicutes bacterium]|nr:hypothetical protein [Bacillota bacterium]
IEAETKRQYQACDNSQKLCSVIHFTEPPFFIYLTKALYTRCKEKTPEQVIVPASVYVIAFSSLSSAVSALL